MSSSGSSLAERLDLKIAETEETAVAPPVAKTTAKPASKSAKKVRRNLQQTLRTFHQRGGMFAFLFMAWLGFSGILLNQSADWGLDAIRVKASSIMSFYGLHTEPPKFGYFSGESWLVPTLENTVINGHLAEEHIPSPLGMVSIGEGDAELIFVASHDSLSIFTADVKRLDKLSGYMLPLGQIRRIGARGNKVALQGESVYLSTDGISWETYSDSGASIQWSESSRLPEEIAAETLPHARPSVALEQLLIDLHSGRLFGKFGAYFVNLVGIVCIWLSVSGVWMMWRTQKMRNNRGKN